MRDGWGGGNSGRRWSRNQDSGRRGCCSSLLLLQRREHFLLNEAIQLLPDSFQRSLVRVPERCFLLDLPAVDAEVVVLEQLLVDVGRDRRVEDRVLVAELREGRNVLVVGVLGHAGQVEPREVGYERAQEAGLDLEQRG